MKVLVLYYSMYGHIHRMAEAVAEGVREVAGAEAVLRRVPETLPPEVLEKMGAVEAQKALSHIPIATVDELPGYDAIIFGTPTRFGNMCGQMRQFLDATGQHWVKGSLIGKVAAGSPILAQENVLRHPAIDPLMFKPRADYLLEVRGMSMRDLGILDGDWLAVHKQAQAQSGQIVVARLGDDVTVKRLKLKGARAELIAENPDFAPIVVDLKRDPFAIEGIAVGVIRPSL